MAREKTRAQLKAELEAAIAKNLNMHIELSTAKSVITEKDKEILRLRQQFEQNERIMSDQINEVRTQSESNRLAAVRWEDRAMRLFKLMPWYKRAAARKIIRHNG